MKRRIFIMALFAASLLFGGLPRSRVQYRMTTEGSEKWKAGHRAGCVFYAPEGECICDEIKADYEREHGKLK